MAKKIRQVTLTEEDILKNSGKDISHSIAREKKKEKIYTFVLVIAFIITIPMAIFLSFRVDSKKLFDAGFYKDASISLNGEFITLDDESVLTDNEALAKEPYTIQYNNLTTNNINFIIRFAKDENAIATCDCNNKLLDYHKIKYSIDGKTVHSFSDETMLITADMIRAREKEQLKIWLWIDDKVSKKDVIFLGKIVLEELEDMDI